MDFLQTDCCRQFLNGLKLVSSSIVCPKDLEIWTKFPLQFRHDFYQGTCFSFIFLLWGSFINHSQCEFSVRLFSQEHNSANGQISCREFSILVTGISNSCSLAVFVCGVISMGRHRIQV